ncbi:hypothetical protein ACFTZF_33730 [Streptomyces mirabilis]|uniref:hypothetical protein n=1 Tax=Streptomyces mirabilis TaxID=68239 RepID=UPI00363384DA
MPSIHDSATWEPVLRLLRTADAESIVAPGDYVAGRIGRHGSSLPMPRRRPQPERALQIEDMQDDVVGCELFSLYELYLADAPSRPPPWKSAAMKAVGTPSDAAVRGLVGSLGWIVFGDNGGGDRIAVDLTPGPRGHAGRIIMLDHEQDVGGDLLADSLTDLVSNGLGEGRRGPRGDQPLAVARVNIGGLSSVEAAAHPDWRSCPSACERGSRSASPPSPPSDHSDDPRRQPRPRGADRFAPAGLRLEVLSAPTLLRPLLRIARIPW